MFVVMLDFIGFKMAMKKARILPVAFVERGVREAFTGRIEYIQRAVLVPLVPPCLLRL